MIKRYCENCDRTITNTDTFGINRKLLGEDIRQYLCRECLAEHLGCSLEDIEEKIKEFKEEDCRYFL